MVAAVLFALLAGAFIAGVFVQKQGYPGRVWHRLTEALEPRTEVQTAHWTRAVLNQHTLEWAQFQVAHVAGGGGGGLAEVNGHIVVSTPQGRFSYFSPNATLAPIGLRAPLNLEELRAAPIANDPMFQASGVRVQDLFARPASSPGQWELYATLSRYAGENCFQFVLARALLTADAERVSAVSPQWEELYIARPGCIRAKDRNWRFVGMAAGGRIQALDEHTLLISVGDHQFDGFNDSHSASMDPEWDLGKLIAFDLTTRQARVYAQGLRNPQGLLIMRDGRIIETEHGPRGGDEINVIRRGGNYGWPLVTYGMNYGYPRRNWPTDPAPGGHGGRAAPYIAPAFAFVPAVGPSNVVQPSGEEFPLWTDDDVLMGSLRAGTLFHVHLDRDRVAYVEPLSFGHERLRDLIALRDGRIAILTDAGALILIRNAERHENEPRTFTVAGLSTLEADDNFEPDLSPIERGHFVFSEVCASCHSLDGQIGVGPPLNGVVGRDIGSVDGFAYSPALANRGGVWTEDALTAFMTDPEHEIPGSAMPLTTMSWTQAPHVTEFLRTTRAEPER